MEKRILKNVLFVGNSILLGMPGAFGMCASSPQTDYYHQVQQAILAKSPDCGFSKLYISVFERCRDQGEFERWWSEEPNGHTGKPAVCSFTEDLDLILLQMGDNVSPKDNLPAFRENVTRMVQRIRQRSPWAKILWIYGWFNGETMENAICQICEQCGLQPVSVRSLRSKENESYAGASFTMPDGTMETVKDEWVTHPGDGGMREIAARIIEALNL